MKRTMQSKAKQPVTRQEKALATRRRMLQAAYDLFCAHGYAATTMERIAQEAGVAVQTLYFTFRTKSAILGETIGAAILGFDRWDPRAEPAVTRDPRQALRDFHPWFAAFESAPTQAEALAVFVDSSMEILARVSPLVGVMSAAASADPALKAVEDLAEQRRVEGFHLLVAMLHKRGGLRRGVTVRRGTDILLTLLSAEVYQLATGRGWSRNECRKWLVDVLVQQLLDDPHA